VGVEVYGDSLLREKSHHVVWSCGPAFWWLNFKGRAKIHTRLSRWGDLCKLEKITERGIFSVLWPQICITAKSLFTWISQLGLFGR